MATHDLTTEDGMLSYLTETHYPQCAAVEQLAGGSTGYVYRAATGNAESPSVVVKHAEGYAARAPSWKLNANRMHFEAEALRYLSQPEQIDPVIRVPRLLHYDHERHVLVMEDVGSLPSLKTWVTEAVDVASCRQIGEAIGRFLARFHDASHNRSALLTRFTGNETAKYLSGKLYFGSLPSAAAKLGFEDAFIAEAARAGEEEVTQRSDVLTMGDFWTGNVLVSAPAVQDQSALLYVLDWEFAKPGTAEFDIGQMAAEMWCLASFRKGVEGQGLALLEAFLTSYRAERSMEVDATNVAIRVGAHLFVIMPLAWSSEATPEQIRIAAAEAREFVRMGWERDEDALKDSVLEGLVS